MTPLDQKPRGYETRIQYLEDVRGVTQRSGGSNALTLPNTWCSVSAAANQRSVAVGPALVRLLLAQANPAQFNCAPTTSLLTGAFQYSMDRGLIPLVSRTTARSLAAAQSTFNPPILATPPNTAPGCRTPSYHPNTAPGCRTPSSRSTPCTSAVLAMATGVSPPALISQNTAELSSAHARLTDPAHCSPSPALNGARPDLRQTISITCGSHPPTRPAASPPSASTRSASSPTPSSTDLLPHPSSPSHDYYAWVIMEAQHRGILQSQANQASMADHMTRMEEATAERISRLEDTILLLSRAPPTPDHQPLSPHSNKPLHSLTPNKALPRSSAVGALSVMDDETMTYSSKIKISTPDSRLLECSDGPPDFPACRFPGPALLTTPTCLLSSTRPIISTSGSAILPLAPDSISSNNLTQPPPPTADSAKPMHLSPHAPSAAAASPDLSNRPAVSKQSAISQEAPQLSQSTLDYYNDIQEYLQQTNANETEMKKKKKKKKKKKANPTSTPDNPILFYV
ncbi:hypothetical protein PCANC_05276 [Puccinia coronata f. sp. avenae]|uniref:Uncharacterized protein n=1 Tax=Puccinia coronata f. sp. avenae TaxID=200324 RepID=A0A2N5VYT9_9BASI|nr:hypothetical protein PCANC_05276 [Puccinia coronata f. sp. avenae]